jgi:uncharacterized lipoprotein YddW (UPF0748 family)
MGTDLLSIRGIIPLIRRTPTHNKAQNNTHQLTQNQQPEVNLKSDHLHCLTLDLLFPNYDTLYRSLVQNKIDPF